MFFSILYSGNATNNSKVHVVLVLMGDQEQLKEASCSHDEKPLLHEIEMSFTRNMSNPGRLEHISEKEK